MHSGSRREASREAKHTGFPYQVEAVEALKDLPYSAIFHEQGLGKTKIAIDLALSWLRRDLVDAVLFITKKALVANWTEEINRHSFIRPRVLGQDRNANFHAFNSPARFFVAHYEVCVSELSRLRLFLKARRIGVICDEAHKFKNPESSVTKALFALGPSFARRVILTGTPIANRPYDIWAQIYFLDQGKSLGTDFAEFKKATDLTKGLEARPESQRQFETLLDGLFYRIEDFAIRETKASAGIHLPSKTIENILVDPADRQRELYRAYRDELRAVVLRQGIPHVDEAHDLLKRLLRLVQLASNPHLVDQSYQETPGKLDVLKALLVDHISGNGSGKAIVWTSFTENADWLTKALRDEGAVKLHGKLSMEERNRAVTRFKQDDDVRILVATPGAGKEGLTLTVANVAIFFDRSFSLDDYLQAQDRIHRISQNKPCFVYNLIMRDTVDEWVDELLGAKHLAAQLALGDIDKKEYEEAANYGFASTLSRILGSTVES